MALRARRRIQVYEYSLLCLHPRCFDSHPRRFSLFVPGLRFPPVDPPVDAHFFLLLVLIVLHAILNPLLNAGWQTAAHTSS